MSFPVGCVETAGCPGLVRSLQEPPAGLEVKHTALYSMCLGMRSNDQNKTQLRDHSSTGEARAVRDTWTGQDRPLYHFYLCIQKNCYLDLARPLLSLPLSPACYLSFSLISLALSLNL